MRVLFSRENGLLAQYPATHVLFTSVLVVQRQRAPTTVIYIMKYSQLLPLFGFQDVE